MAEREISATPLQLTDLPEELKLVQDAWGQAKGSDIGPSRKAFDLLFIPLNLLPYSSVTDYFADSDEFIIRFFGTGLVSIDGIDMTGKNLSETSHPDLRRLLESLFRKVVDEKHENFSEFNFLSKSGTQRMSITGRWPLSENGIDVSGILSVIYLADDKQHLNEILGRDDSR